MTNPVKITVHSAGDGVCALSGKEQDGLTVSFEDGTVTQQHLSWKSFRQLVAMKTAQAGAKPAPRPVPAATLAPPMPPISASAPIPVAK